MGFSRRSSFVIYESLLIVLGFTIAAQLSPPDPYSQIIGTLVVLTVTLPLSYWLAYKRQ
jgi:Sec-independent protein secretion pathway component TatC